MKTTLILFCVPVAFVAGYFFGGVRSNEDTPSAPSTRSEARTRISAQPRSYRPDPAFPQRFKTADYSEQQEMIESLSPENRLAHISQLLALSNPEGLDYELKSAIEKLIEAAMSDSPEATLDWVMSMEHIGYRDHLLDNILDDKDRQGWIAENFDSLLNRLKVLEHPHSSLKKLIGTKTDSDPVAAIRLSKELLVDHRGKIDFPPLLQEKAVAHGWETALEYFKDSWQEENTVRGSSWVGEFPSGFDFAAFAAAWKEHEGSLGVGENGGFYTTPAYLWKAWAKQDPEAAFDYLKSGATKTFDFSDFFDGYEQVAEPTALFDFSREIINGEEQYQSALKSELHGYLVKNPVYARQFITWTNETGDSALLKSVLGEISPHYQDSTALGKTLLESLPADQRLPTIRSAFTRTYGNGLTSYDLYPTQLDAITTILTDLGHPESEVKKALSSE